MAELAEPDEVAHTTGDEEEEGWYSVWAEAGDARSAAAAAMERLRTVVGDATSECWEAHVTVVGVPQTPVPLRSAIGALRYACRSLSPFACRLTRPSTGFQFYQCVFMLVDPSQQVMEMHNHVQGVFEQEVPGYSEEREYMPHMSLYYGDLTQENQKKATELVKAEFDNLLCNKEFTVSKLCLYSTPVESKSVKSWRKVAEFPLEGNSTE